MPRPARDSDEEIDAKLGLYYSFFGFCTRTRFTRSPNVTVDSALEYRTCIELTVRDY